MRCLLIEDEPLAREVIEGYIKDTPNLELVRSFANALAAYSYMEEQAGDYDFLILDINMPKIKGTEFLKSLEKQPPVIFVTAYSEYAVESYDFNTVDYLTKPVAFPRFLKAIDKMRSRLTEQEKPNISKGEFLFIKDRHLFQKVEFQQILWVEGMADYVKICLKDKSYVHYASLKSMLQQLPGNFIRVHQSYIVNEREIQTVTGNRLIISGTEIPIGRTYKSSLMGRLKI